MFSSRGQFPLTPNALSEALAARRVAGSELLDLTLSNPTQAGFEYPASLLAALADPRGLRYEPEPFGLLSARETVAASFRARGAAVDAADVLHTASTSEAYALLFKLLCDPGDEVLVPRPGYPLFDLLAPLESVRLVSYPIRYDGSWHLDWAALMEAVTPRTRAVVVVSPHNPTGAFLKKSELEALNALCRERGLALVVDEVFSEYLLSTSRDPHVETVAGNEGALTFALGGLSKSCGLPQAKLAWTVVSGPADLRREALARMEIIADAFLSASTIVQMALADLLVAGAAIRTAIHARVRENLNVLRAQITSSSPWSLCSVEGGWTAVLRVPTTRSEEAWALALLDDGVLVHPGYFFDFEEGAHLVVSLLPEPRIFAEGMRKIAAVIV